MWAGDAGGVQPDFVQQRLHALFGERVQHRFQPRHGQAVVDPLDARLQLGEQILFVGPLLFVKDLGRRL